MKFERNYYLNKLIKNINNKQVKIITGIRRCGKSFLLFNLFYDYLIKTGVKDNQIIKIELDKISEKHLCNPMNLYNHVLKRIKNKKQYFLFIDEIQMCDDFNAVLNDFIRIDNLDVFVTGSNSKMLSKDIVTTFRGRGCQIKLQPLSFKEFYEAKRFKDFNDAIKEYVTFGGMPFTLYKDSDEDKMDYLKELFEETYIKDIKERSHIRTDNILSNLIDVLASCIGGFTNCLKLSNTIKTVSGISISQNTLSKYLELLEESFVIKKSLKYDVKGKRYLSCPFKYYFTDLGLRNARLDFRQTEITHLIENLVFNELLLRGYSVDTGIVEINEAISYQKYQRKQLECDFVINKANNKIYVQCCYSLADLEKMKQEIKPLININDSFKKVIITNDNIKSYITQEGIEIVSLQDFLLGQSSIWTEEKDKYTWEKTVNIVNNYK